jgi:L-rhamnose mutarotase
MAERVGFVLEVRPERIGEYVAAHREVWPEMLEALKGAGIRNYTIFRAGTRVFGYFETDDRDASERFLAAQPVCARWQNTMAAFLVARVDDAGPEPLEEIFRLE